MMETTKNRIPTIDLSRIDSEEPVVIDELMVAFTTIGFATLVNHGIESHLIDKAFDASRSFFELDLHDKLKYGFQGHKSNRGYIPPGSETHDLTDDCPPDTKETFDIGKEDEPGFPNLWPEELAEESFRSDILEYYTMMDRLFLRLMRMIGTGLQLSDPDYLVKRCNGQHENLRLLRYPALRVPNHHESIVRGNIHTDFGALTLLVQDNVGGLRVQRRDGGWADVAPVPHSIIVNVGDMLMRWSNDRLKATLHQVVTPPLVAKCREESEKIPERYSIAFFCNANKDAMLECLETCKSNSEPAKYPHVNAHEYLTKRLQDTIADQKS